MHYTYFTARCDVELKDKVLFDGRVAIITDIRCIHYLVSGEVKFEFKLNLHYDWVLREMFIYPIKEGFYENE